MYKYLLALLLCAAMSTLMPAQSPPEVKGYFTADSFMVGQRVDYVLTCRYPKTRDLFFPDTVFDFKPFEFYSKQAFPTVSDEEFSVDSAIYTLTCFELEDSVALALPVYLLQAGGDSVKLLPNPSVLKLKRLLTPPLPDTLQLLDHTEPAVMQREPEVVMIVLAVNILLAFLGVFIELYGLNLLNVWKRRRLTGTVNHFTQQFHKLTRAGDVAACEQITALWKKHMQYLSGVPYTSFTTKEIEDYTRNSRLATSLRLLDHTVYGNAPAPSPEHLTPLLTAANDAKRLKMTELVRAGEQKTYRAHEQLPVSYVQPSLPEKIKLVQIIAISIFTLGWAWPYCRPMYYRLLNKGYTIEGLTLEFKDVVRYSYFIPAWLLLTVSISSIGYCLNTPWPAVALAPGILMAGAIALLRADNIICFYQSVFVTGHQPAAEAKPVTLALKTWGAMALALCTAGLTGPIVQKLTHRYLSGVLNYHGLKPVNSLSTGNLILQNIKGAYFTVFTLGLYAPLYWGNVEAAYLKTYRLIPKRGPMYEPFFNPPRKALYMTYAKAIALTVLSLGLLWPVAAASIKQYKAAHLKLPAALKNEWEA